MNKYKNKNGILKFRRLCVPRFETIQQSSQSILAEGLQDLLEAFQQLRSIFDSEGQSEVKKKSNILSPYRKGLSHSPLHVDVHHNPYVRRREIWETLNSNSLSINAAARLLEKGKQFRKWANTSGAPNELTRVSREELRKLEGVDSTKAKIPEFIFY